MWSDFAAWAYDDLEESPSESATVDVHHWSTPRIYYDLLPHQAVIHRYTLCILKCGKVILSL